MNTTQSNHTHLYITLGLLVILAIIFLGLRPHFNLSDIPSPAELNLKYKSVVLTPEQSAVKQEQLKNPALVETQTLTKTQQEEKKKLLQDPMLTQTKNN